MAFAMRINFVDVVCDDSMKSRLSVRHQIKLLQRTFPFCIDEFGVKLDGEEVPTEDIKFCLHGKEFGIAQLHDLVSEFWQITEPATIKIFKDGGIVAGEHDVDVKLMFHSPYMPISDTEYMPIDGCGSKKLTLAEF